MLTPKLPKSTHVLLGKDLGMFQARAQRADVCCVKGSFKCIQHDAICPIADCMDILNESCKLSPLNEAKQNHLRLASHVADIWG
jgi:hypothetical protein